MTPCCPTAWPFWTRIRAVAVMGPRILNRDGSVQPSSTAYPSLRHLMAQTLGLTRFKALDSYRMTGWDRRDFRRVEVISGCAMLVRRAAMDKVGLLDEGFFFYGEETDWCRRFADAGWSVVFAPVGEITHFGGGSVRAMNHRRDVMLTEGTMRLHRKHGGLLGGLACYRSAGGVQRIARGSVDRGRAGPPPRCDAPARAISSACWAISARPGRAGSSHEDPSDRPEYRRHRRRRGLCRLQMGRGAGPADRSDGAVLRAARTQAAGGATARRARGDMGRTGLGAPQRAAERDAETGLAGLCRPCAPLADGGAGAGRARSTCRTSSCRRPRAIPRRCGTFRCPM